VVDITRQRTDFESGKEFFSSVSVQRFLLFMVIFLVPIFIMNRFPDRAIFPDNTVVKIIFSIGLAGMISLFWAMFLCTSSNQSDLFELKVKS
jgi:hypothetical protein